MKKCVCDRCGKEIPSDYPIDLPDYDIVAIYDVCDVKGVDLCPECREEFKRWMNNDR